MSYLPIPKHNVAVKFIVAAEKRYGIPQNRDQYNILAKVVHHWLRLKGIAGFICRRCGGHGKMDQFWHVNNGVCFKCNGRGLQDTHPGIYTQGG